MSHVFLYVYPNNYGQKAFLTNKRIYKFRLHYGVDAKKI